MAEEIMMSSLPDLASPPLAPIPAVSSVAEPPPLPVAATSRPPRTWYFIGTTLFGLGVFAALSLAQLATFIALIWHSGIPMPTPEQVRALTRDGGWLALCVIASCPATLGALWIPIRIVRQRYSDYLALRWPHRGEVVRSLAMLAALLVTWFLLRMALGQTMPAFMTETYRSASASGTLVVYIVGLCIAAPIAEEFLVRGFLFRGWSQSFLGPIGTIVLTSIAWAALHTQYNAFYMSEIFTLGILLGVLRHRSGSTWLTVILHAANNAVAIAHVALVVAYA
jgi:membrane protease YdiL (CAAX protease family)